jgi:hypothetical protein
METLQPNCKKECALVGHQKDCPNYKPEDKASCLSFEDSQEAALALGTLKRLGLITWKRSETDPLGIELEAELKLAAHDGWSLSPYIISHDGKSGKTIFWAVAKTTVRDAWNVR